MQPFQIYLGNICLFPKEEAMEGNAHEASASHQAIKDTKSAPHDWHHICTDCCHHGIASEVSLQDGVDTVK
eukprot:10271890-Ditylum_brightwellii.AAC.1